jgi:hypothetical protein
VADETKAEPKKGSLLNQILVPAIIAIIAGGSSPWWLKAFSHNSTPDASTAAITSLNQQPTVSHPEPPKAPVASREFFLGRWRVDQENVLGQGVHSVNTATYFDNGRFEGHDLVANSYQGGDIKESGTWEVERLSDQSFQLSLHFDNGTAWKGEFRIIDQDHIHNIGDNYIAERVK